MPGLTEIQLQRVPGHVESQKAEEVSTSANSSAISIEAGLGSDQESCEAGHHTHPPTIGRRGASRNSLRATNGRAAMPRYITYTHCTCAMRKSVLLRRQSGYPLAHSSSNTETPTPTPMSTLTPTSMPIPTPIPALISNDPSLHVAEPRVRSSSSQTNRTPPGRPCPLTFQRTETPSYSAPPPPREAGARHKS